MRGSYEQDLDAQQLFARIAQQDPRATQLGLKTFREQIGDEALEPLLAAADHLLLLERSNLTAALVSELRAQQTSLWHATNKRTVAKDLAAEALVVDIEAGRQRLRHALDNGSRINAMAAAAGIRTMRLTYEDLVATTEATMNRVFVHLGVDARPVHSSFRRVHKAWDFVGNLDEVNRELGPEFGTLA
ncbi:MAG: hypothetical protein GY949_06795 [Gammaproteobacteria bacterium]|nr:hypothetical protein [Gammaproteobacteria bacterium]